MASIKDDLFFTLSIWKLSSPYQGVTAVVLLFFPDIEASNFFP